MEKQQETMQEEVFALEVIAKGAFVDKETGSGKTFLVETTIVRFNGAAMQVWQDSVMLNSRDCYETNEEWEAHQADYAQRRKEVQSQIIAALGLRETLGSICITRSLSEVFTVVQIYDITKA